MTAAAVVRGASRPPDTTYGICSDLRGGEAQAAATTLWDHLERRYGLAEARAAIRPHVSYLVGEVTGGPVQVEALSTRVAAAASGIAPVEIEIGGVGVFDGPAPALYLRVVRSEPLLRTHAAILGATRDAFTSIWPYYLPDAWTLALRDLAPDCVADVRADLDARARERGTRLEAVDFVHVVFPRHVYLGRCMFGGEAAR